MASSRRGRQSWQASVGEGGSRTAPTVDGPVCLLIGRFTNRPYGGWSCVFADWVVHELPLRVDGPVCLPGEPPLPGGVHCHCFGGQYLGRE